MDLRRGAAINREDTQRAKMMKAEKKEEAEAKLLPDRMQPHQKNRVFHNRPPPRSEKKKKKKKRLPTKTKNSVLFGTTTHSQSE